MKTTRAITEQEFNFIKGLIARSGNTDLLSTIPEKVIELDDGGMGSIRLDPDESNAYGSELISVEYLDSDNTLVSIGLYLNKNGELSELDFFKVDFSRLITYPTIDNIKSSIS